MKVVSFPSNGELNISNNVIWVMSVLYFYQHLLETQYAQWTKGWLESARMTKNKIILENGGHISDICPQLRYIYEECPESIQGVFK